MMHLGGRAMARARQSIPKGTRVETSGVSLRAGSLVGVSDQ